MKFMAPPLGLMTQALESVKPMKNSTVFTICLITYLAFVVLIITEPIGYDPLRLCLFFFFVFLSLYLFLTHTLEHLGQKLPERAKTVLNRTGALAEVVFIIFWGWRFYEDPEWIFKNKHPYILAAITAVVLAFVFTRAYRIFMNDRASNHEKS